MIFAIILLVLGFILLSLSWWADDEEFKFGIGASACFFLIVGFIGFYFESYKLGQQDNARATLIKSIPRYEANFVEKPSGEKIIEVFEIKSPAEQK